MNALTGFTIGATDGDIGRIEAFYFDDLSYTVRHLVADTGGWLGGRKVLISPRALGRIDWDGSRVNASLTKAQVENSPSIETDQPVSSQKEIEYHRFYGYPTYWSGPYLWGDYPLPVMGPGAARDLAAERRWDWTTKEHGDPHLRSSAVVIGYHIQATDGEIGHVDDVLVEEDSWNIRYVVLDTSNWIGGRSVVISPRVLKGVDLPDRVVTVDVARDDVRRSPELDTIDVGPGEDAPPFAII
jgi:hypothetical protein